MKVARTPRDSSIKVYNIASFYHYLPPLFYTALPNGAFNRVTCLITVFITVERCLCFVMPLRVKSLVTPVRSAIIVAVIFLVGTLPLVPQYMATQLAWRPEPGRNKSLLGVVLAKRKDSVVLFQIANVMNLSMQLFSTAALVVANIALAVSVKKQEKWRLGTAATTAPQQGRAAAGSSGTSAAVVDSSTYRNKRLARMIQFLSLILFGAFFSSTFFFLVSVILPAFDLYGEYSTEFRISWMFALIAQTLNSSVNIVFYYRMNSRFRNAFNKMFRRGVARVGIFPADHNTMDNTIVALSHRPRPT